MEKTLTREAKVQLLPSLERHGYFLRETVTRTPSVIHEGRAFLLKSTH